MTDQQGVEALEVERKYEVGPEARLPDPGVFAALGLRADEPVTHELRARYFDTLDGDLARRGLALRERHGGKDAGWHLKERGPSGVRELLWPPADELPAALAAEVRTRVGAAAALVPIADLRTTRTVLLLRDAAGAEAAELADDRVRATDSAGVRRAWREWEAELAPGAAPDLLDRIEPALLAAGAVPSPSPAKIARATGRLVQLAAARGADAERLAALRALDEADRAAGRRLDA